MTSAHSNYDFRNVEQKWRECWERSATSISQAPLLGEKYYVLEMLPYPSGDLHVGHAKNYTIGDALARIMRMLGYNVLHPMGWDAFGLPAENAASLRGVEPAAWTHDNITNMRRQLKLLGTRYDWSREFATCDSTYYRWNQWIFSHLYNDGLAYKRMAAVNWDPIEKTVLANEQVINGKGWRSNAVVERRYLSQWFLKITNYADRLLEGSERLTGWPDNVRAMQRNWIGRSQGVTCTFKCEGIAENIEIYTSRIDTIFGVTFLAVAPEHPIIETLKEAHPEHASAIDSFIRVVASKNEIERTSVMPKEGVFTGTYALGPVSGKRIPVWIVNYVLPDYGTGAIMGVPAHDERDLEFARLKALPIVTVVTAARDLRTHKAGMVEAFTEDGILTASGAYSGLPSAEARELITQRMIDLGVGQRTTSYRLRDWLISRQRYWGTPIPIVYCPIDGEVLVPWSDLPVTLPGEMPPSGDGAPLSNVSSFVETQCPRCGGPARRETDTMDTFFESSWYYLRYLDPTNETMAFDSTVVDPWLNVDQYIGGSEHSVLHLLYARFFYKYFIDKGWINGRDEPFDRLFNQGMVLLHGEKMSKSRGNVVSIEETALKYGVDAMRMFLLKATSPEDAMEWSDEGIAGRVRFLDRLWRACFATTKGDITAIAFARDVEIANIPNATTDVQFALLRSVHVALSSLIEETTTRRFHYNTTLARLDELVNLLTKYASSSNCGDYTMSYAIRVIPLLIAPFAPHMAEELWHAMGFHSSIHDERLPAVDELLLSPRDVEMIVQINGKVRARLVSRFGLDEETAYQMAIENPNVRVHLDGTIEHRRVFVPGRLLNIVVSRKSH